MLWWILIPSVWDVTCSSCDITGPTTIFGCCFSPQGLSIPAQAGSVSVEDCYSIGCLSAGSGSVIGSSMASSVLDSFVPSYLKRVEAEENWLAQHAAGDTSDYIKRV